MLDELALMMILGLLTPYLYIDSRDRERQRVRVRVRGRERERGRFILCVSMCR